MRANCLRCSAQELTSISVRKVPGCSRFSSTRKRKAPLRKKINRYSLTNARNSSRSSGLMIRSRVTVTGPSSGSGVNENSCVEPIINDVVFNGAGSRLSELAKFIESGMAQGQTGRQEQGAPQQRWAEAHVRRGPTPKDAAERHPAL